MTAPRGDRPSRLVVAVVVASLCHVFIVLPGVTLYLLERQASTDRNARHELCVQNQANREAWLDLVDYATQPSDIDPDRIESGELRSSILAGNAKAAAVRAFTHDRLPPIDC